MKKQAGVNWSRACVGACSLWDPGDSSPPAASWGSARYLDFLLLRLRDDKTESPDVMSGARDSSECHKKEAAEQMSGFAAGVKRHRLAWLPASVTTRASQPC